MYNIIFSTQQITYNYVMQNQYDSIYVTLLFDHCFNSPFTRKHSSSMRTTHSSPYSLTEAPAQQKPQWTEPPVRKMRSETLSPGMRQTGVKTMPCP